MLKLGTKQHHDVLLGPIDSLADTGCFALTELGFGEAPPTAAACCLHPVACSQAGPATTTWFWTLHEYTYKRTALLLAEAEGTH